MSELRRFNGVYLVGPERTISCYDQLPEPQRQNLDRLRYQVITHNGMPPLSLWDGRFHGNEGTSADLQEEINSQYAFSRVEAWTGHELATQIHKREYILPMNGHSNTIPGRVIRLSDGRLGKVVDLNRQYEMPLVLMNDWESIIGNIAYAPARLPLQLVHDHPTVKTIVSIHEDLEHNNYPYPFVQHIPRVRKQNGFYLYDIKAYRDDPFDAVVDRQMGLLRRALKAHGFTLFNGVDDDRDPHLGNKVTEGLARQTVYDRDGQPHLDNTFELFLVYLQTLGLTNVKRAFIPEIPGKMPKEKKKELLQIVTETFLFPVLGEMGAL